MQKVAKAKAISRDRDKLDRLGNWLTEYDDEAFGKYIERSYKAITYLDRQAPSVELSSIIAFSFIWSEEERYYWGTMCNEWYAHLAVERETRIKTPALIEWIEEQHERLQNEK